MTASSPVDVLIIGGGPAGLAAATALNRLMHPCIVFDHGVYRNERSKHMHNLPTWDHRDPADFRAAGRKDLTERYNTTRIVNSKVENLTKLDNGTFQATDSEGKKYIGKKVILATGVEDLYPDIAGYDECWGYGIYHCLFCHGYEERNTPRAAILAVEDTADAKYATTVALMAQRLAQSVTILTHNNTTLTSELLQSAAASKNLQIDSRPISRLLNHPSPYITVQFSDGSTSTFGFIAHKPRTKFNGPWAEQLGLELTAGQEDLKVSAPWNETSVHGVFAAGDCASAFKAVGSGISMGMFAGNGAGMQVLLEGV